MQVFTTVARVSFRDGWVGAWGMKLYPLRAGWVAGDGWGNRSVRSTHRDLGRVN